MSHSKPSASPQWTSLPNAADLIPWRRNGGLRSLNFFISILYVGQILNGYDSSLISGLQAMTPWQVDMGHPNSNRLGMLNALAYVSGILTGPFVSYVSDRWGRKWTMRYYGLAMIAGTIIGVIAGTPGVNGFALFCVSKIIIGTGLTCGILTSQILLQEISHPRYRSLTASVFNTNWAVGSLLQAWVNFGCAFITTRWCYRIPYLLQLVPALYILVATQFVPESPRYLMSKGREDEALAFLVKFHGNGNPNDELVLFEFAEMQEAITAEKAAAAQKISQLFATRGNRKRMLNVALLACMQQLNGSAIIYFYYYQILYNIGMIGAAQSTGLNAGLLTFDFITSFFGVYLSQKITRRRLTLIFWPFYGFALVIMAITGAVYAHTGNKASAGGTIFGMWMVYASLGTIETPIFFAMPAEILHYSMRSKGMAFGNLITQVCGVFNTWVNSIAYGALGWKFYLIWIPVIFIQSVLCYFYLVETKGYTLEEIAIAFDGEGSALAPHVRPHLLEEGSTSSEKGDEVKEAEATVQVLPATT